MMVGMACLCYNFVTACLSQHINARYLSSISMVFGGLGALFFALLHSPTLRLTAISIFLSAITTANVILISVIIEAFPSNLRLISLNKINYLLLKQAKTKPQITTIILQLKTNNFNLKTS